jgi:hypothetical protein
VLAERQGIVGEDLGSARADVDEFARGELL